MTITELRIGNYCLDNKGEASKWEKWMFDCTQDFEEIEPVPLTEEWLVKWRFDKDKSTRNLLFDYIIYFERQGNQLFLCNNQTKVQYLIEWVHEAQNIYFALTGEELVCK